MEFGNSLTSLTSLTPTAAEPKEAVDPVRALLDNPPPWLEAQLEGCRQMPARFMNPTASAIARQVYGTAMRWREVKPILEEVIAEDE